MGSYIDADDLEKTGQQLKFGEPGLGGVAGLATLALWPCFCAQGKPVPRALSSTSLDPDRKLLLLRGVHGPLSFGAFRTDARTSQDGYALATSIAQYPGPTPQSRILLGRFS